MNFIHLTDDQARQIISSAVSAALAGLSPVKDKSGIEPMKVYSYKSTAEILDTPIKSVYNIPEDELPRVRRAGSSVGFLGIQLLRYIHGLDPINTEKMVDELSEVVKEQLEATAVRTKITPMPKSRGRKTRVF